MKYPIAEKTVNPRLAAGSQATYAPLSLEPASYSIPIPDPAAASPSNSGPLHAIHSEATLPGYASRTSLDLPEAPQPCSGLLNCRQSVSPPRGLPPLPTTISFAGRDRHAPYMCPAAPDPVAPPPTEKLQRYNPQAYFQGHQQHALQQQYSQQQQQLQQQGLRPSIDAAADAQVLGTCPVPDWSLQQHASAPVTFDPPPFTFLGRATSGPPAPPAAAGLRTAQSVPQPQLPTPRMTAPACLPPQDEWTFGDNLQHARVIARHAALDAADDIVYEPPGGGRDSDDDEDGGSGHRARGPWKVLTSLLGSSRVHKIGTGQHSQQGARGQGSSDKDVRHSDRGEQAEGWTAGSSLAGAAGGGRGGGKGGARAGSGGGAGHEGPPPKVVIRSRDSRRLLRVHRCRVGIDRDGQGPGAAVRCGVAAASVVKAMTSKKDPATAAVVAAAAAFAADMAKV